LSGGESKGRTIPEGKGRYLGGWTYAQPPPEEAGASLAGPGWNLFGAMLREEWRLHRSFVGAMGSGFFPVVIFLFSLVLAATSPVLLKKLDMTMVLLVLHLAAVMYGLGVGALARIGEQVMTRRLGQVNMLLQLPMIHPVRFRTVMGIFYVKDAVFYILYSIIPLVGGIAVAIPLTRITIAGVGLLFITMLLTFLTGMSLSFLISALSIRSRAAMAALVLVILALVATVWPLGLLAPGQVLLPLGYWGSHDILYLLVSLLLVLGLSAAAVLVMKERFAPPEKRYDSVLLRTENTFRFSKGLTPLVAKEWLELRRSGALGPVFTGFLGPLLGVYAIIWLFRTGMGIPLDFNVVFYGGILGFLGLMTYSWLTNIEPNEFLNVQPVGVDEVIRAKLVLYFLLTTPISLGYLIIIGALNGEWGYLPVAAVVGLSTMVYVAAVTGHMTGLRANTMLFDPKVLGRFSAAIVLPLIVITFASFLLHAEPLLAGGLLVTLSATLLVASKLLLDGLAARWRGTQFGI
jgi:hypothetical protein